MSGGALLLELKLGQRSAKEIESNLTGLKIEPTTFRDDSNALTITTAVRQKI